MDVDGLEPWNVLPGVTVTATKSASKSVSLVSTFKAVMHAVPGAAGALSSLIPDNKTGEAIVGGVVGVGEAGRDALIGTYNMVRHPINTFQGIAEMSTVQGQVNAAVNVATNYVQSSSEFGEAFTNARYISYAITSIGIAVAGPKVLKGVAGTGVKAAAKGGMTELQLVTKAAQKAEAAIGGSGGVAGTLKHTYAKNLLSRYQSMYGGNLSLGSNYFNGPAGRGFLDAVNHSTKTIYDFKFGNAFMSNSQFLKYSNSFPGYGIQIIKP